MSRFRRKPQPYLFKIPGLNVPKPAMAMKRGSSRKPAAAPVGRMAWTGPCAVKKLVKGFYCSDCKRELEQYDTRNGICKRCEKTPTKIDFCAVRLELLYRAACHPNKTSGKPFR